MRLAIKVAMMSALLAPAPFLNPRSKGPSPT